MSEATHEGRTDRLDSFVQPGVIIQKVLVSPLRQNAETNSKIIVLRRNEANEASVDTLGNF